jgi:ABC-type ATPase with predicted acetyltransferase domain
VTYDDRVEIGVDRSVRVVCQNGKAKIFPSFWARSVLRIGGRNVPLQIKEITTEAELEAYEKLSGLHYRNKSKHGRAAVLVAKTSDKSFPPILGYIELASPFYVSKPRARFFDAPFRNGDIKWDQWDANATRKYLGLFVRIARCVVAPEFRGLGLGTLLISKAAAFARRRWHLSGFVPLFIEISADMLRYVPFPHKAGFVYIGETEGNLGRVAKDIDYLTRNASRVHSKEIVREESCGIVDQQVSRMNNALKLMRKHKLTRRQLIKRLGRLSGKTVLRDFALFFQIVSLPKPTFVMGLSGPARKFIERRHHEAVISMPAPRTIQRVNALSESVVLNEVSAVYRTHIRRNTRTHAVQQAFGISPEDLTSEVLRKVTLAIEPGDVVVITGPSGSGKTVLLDIIAGTSRPGLRVSGLVRRPRGARVSTIRPLSSKKSLIEVFGEPDVEAGIRALSQVGLSDAYLYLRRFCELSAGQQYRAMLADLVRRRCNLAVIDEFCSTLDPVTAHTVSASLGKLALATGMTVVVAAPHTGLFLKALRPNKVVTLSSFGNATVKMVKK